MTKNLILQIQWMKIGIIEINWTEYICLTDMIKAKDGDFFVSDWLRNRNTIEFLWIWEEINNTKFNYGEFATIKRIQELSKTAIFQMKSLIQNQNLETSKKLSS